MNPLGSFRKARGNALHVKDQPTTSPMSLMGPGFALAPGPPASPEMSALLTLESFLAAVTLRGRL